MRLTGGLVAYLVVGIVVAGWHTGRLPSGSVLCSHRD